jgi:hypothetical protein
MSTGSWQVVSGKLPLFIGIVVALAALLLLIAFHRSDRARWMIMAPSSWRPPILRLAREQR